MKKVFGYWRHRPIPANNWPKYKNCSTAPLNTRHCKLAKRRRGDIWGDYTHLQVDSRLDLRPCAEVRHTCTPARVFACQRCQVSLAEANATEHLGTVKKYLKTRRCCLRPPKRTIQMYQMTEPIANTCFKQLHFCEDLSFTNFATCIDQYLLCSMGTIMFVHTDTMTQ